MPMYQTKTIASILEPVAQQVSKLIILHEEGEDGNAMPDLERPVQAVSKAVANLVRVGKDTINSSQDPKLKSEMPKALATIEKSSDLLEMACKELKRDPYSKGGRDHLIAGSRSILQGTTLMLVTFDESQVRKICRDCKKVLDYLAISEVIETMEDLVQFVKDLSPSLSKVCLDVEGRRNDLLNPYQRDNLGQHLEQVKTLAPILICSMKIFIQILSKEGKGTEEAVENRSYLAKRMADEVAEIQRLLEESTCAPSDANGGSGSAYNGSANTAEMTFHELLNKVNSSLASKSVGSVNQQSIRAVVEQGFKIADGFEGRVKAEIIEICNELDRVSRQMGHNMGDPKTRKAISDLVRKLETRVSMAVIDRIIQDMADISTPLKQFREAVVSNEAMASKRTMVEQRGQSLKVFSSRLSKTANVVAFANARNRRRSEALHHLRSQVQNLTPQLINAGTIRVNYPDNKAAEENFENLRKQFAEGVLSIRDICDESIDVKIFLKLTEEYIRRSIDLCEKGIRDRNRDAIVEHSAMAARLSNRLLMALNKESDNSDDQNLRRQVNGASDKLKSAIAPFVEHSKAASVSPGGDAGAWKDASSRLRDVVSEVTRLFDDLHMYGMDSRPPPQPMMQQQPQQMQHEIPIIVTPPPPPPMPTNIETPRKEPVPPRPPLPVEVRMPGRPPAPAAVDTDDEEGLFSGEPGSNRPIHAAAHGLYQEVRQWDHTDNEIIAAAKKIAYLLAHLSDLVSSGRGTKKELIACSKGLAEVSERITELAKEYAKHCTDKKIRTNLLQVCEKIPTLGTQLRVISTVKATMMNNTMQTEEDQEAMEMLEYNAHRLNEAVKETVHAAESASIKVRSDAGFKLKWRRKPIWYQQQ